MTTLRESARSNDSEGARSKRRAGSPLAIAVSAALALTIGLFVELSTAPVASAEHTLDLVSVVPARLLETREGPDDKTIDGAFEGIGKVDATGEVALTVAGRGGVPADATAVFLNLTAVTPDEHGFLTAYPCGEDRPLTSNVNYAPGDVSPNAVLAKIGDGGAVCIYTKAASHIIADVNGYVPLGGTPESVVPKRILETRQGPDDETTDGLFEGAGKRSAGATIELTVAGRGGVPDDADAVFLNLTAVDPDGPGFLTAYPCDAALRPTTSNVNYSQGDVSPNAVLAKIGAGGKVCIYTKASSHIIADVNGFVPAGGTPGTVIPARILETREGPADKTIDGLFEGIGKRPAGDIVELTVAGRGGVPADADAVFLNVTAVDPDDFGFITVFPCGEDKPLTSNVNYVPGGTAPNSVLAKIGTDGKVCIFTRAASHIIVDVSGHVPEPVVKGLVDATFGESHGCGLDEDGGVICWGEHTHGELGVGVVTGARNSSLPIQIPGLSGVTALEVSDDYTCAILANATAACWGLNNLGQLGDGTTVNRLTPKVVPGLTGVQEITTGKEHACAVVAGGDVTCWGENGQGQLGDGTQTDRLSPVPVTGLPAGKTVVDLDAGFSHTCAIFDDGTGACWGSNATGYLGDGTFVRRNNPVVVMGLADAVEISVGQTLSCARLGDATVQCWGSKNLLGNGEASGLQPTPVAVGGLSGVTSISVGFTNSCVVLANGGARCWGQDSFGANGDGTIGTELTPVAMTGYEGNIVRVATSDGGHTTCAVLDNTGAVCWGYNFDRQLGVDTEGRGPSLTPVAVGS